VRNVIAVKFMLVAGAYTWRPRYNTLRHVYWIFKTERQ